MSNLSNPQISNIGILPCIGNSALGSLSVATKILIAACISQFEMAFESISFNITTAGGVGTKCAIGIYDCLSRQVIVKLENLSANPAGVFTVQHARANIHNGQPLLLAVTTDDAGLTFRFRAIQAVGTLSILASLPVPDFRFCGETLVGTGGATLPDILPLGDASNYSPISLILR